MVRSRLLGPLVLVVALGSATGCWPFRWALSTDGGVDVRDEASDVPVADAGDVVDAADTIDAAEVVDVPTIEASSETSFDAIEIVDVLDRGDANEGGVDAPDVHIDTGPARTYRIDPRDQVQLLGRVIGTSALPGPTPNQRTATCESGLLGSVLLDATVDPSDPSFVNRTAMVCYRLEANGSIRFDVTDWQPALLNSAPAMMPGFAEQVRYTETCPRGFVLVGFQGEITWGSYAMTWWASRLAAVCAGVDAWAANSEEVPTPASPIFVAARAASASDAGLVDAEAADATSGDASSPVGSDTLPRLTECTLGLRPTASVAACSFPIRGGRPASPMPPRAYFVTCPGGYVPTGYRASVGYFIDALELHCSRLIVE